MEQIKLNEQIDYHNAEVQAQGCWDDCVSYEYTNKPPVADGGAITTCKSTKRKVYSFKKSFFR